MTDGFESCEDGNLKNKDGCDKNCNVECGWKCPLVGQKCIWETCGNGKVGRFEECDHGGNYSDSICNFDCTLK